MTEWIEEPVWENVKRGDFVRLVKGREVHEFELTRSDRSQNGLLPKDWPFWTKPFFKLDGWSLFVEAKPIPPMPTEEGWYLGNDHLAENPHFLMFIDRAGKPHYPDPTKPNGLVGLGDAERFGPFTRLVPEADTARRVLERVRVTVQACDRAVHDGRQTRAHVRETLDDLAIQFGVES